MSGSVTTLLAYLGGATGLVGSLGAATAIFRTRSQNRVDNTNSSETERKGAYERLDSFVDNLEQDNKRLRTENAEQAERIAELTSQLDAAIESHVPRRPRPRREGGT